MDFNSNQPVPFDSEKTEKIAEHYQQIIQLLGEDANREGLLKTPERVSKAMQFLMQGYDQNPEDIIRSAMFTEDYRQMVIVKDIDFYSMCEHHMLPFFGKAHIAYIPNKKITGLSKIARIVEVYARRMQVQERMTRQIADFLNELLKPRGVAVVVEALHLCSMMRGVKKHDSRMTTSAMLGAFRNNMATRMEFLDNISRSSMPLHF